MAPWEWILMKVEEQFSVDTLNSEVAKRLLRIRLRKEREGANLTQQAAADLARMSLSKIIRIETGVVPAATSDVLLLLLRYKSSDAVQEEILGVAEAANRTDEWQKYKRDVSAPYLTFLAFEQSANVIMKYEASAIPGLLQTKEYALALMEAAGVPAAKRKVLWEIREKRQKLLRSDHCPQLQMIIGEACVSRPIGGEGVMRRQLEHLVKLSKVSQIEIQFLPFSAGAHEGMGEPFQVVQFPNANLPDIVFLEGPYEDTILRDESEDVRKYAKRFLSLVELANPQGDLSEIWEVFDFQSARADKRAPRPVSEADDTEDTDESGSDANDG